MGTAFNPAAWSSFFSAEVGASAALAGLTFVAISINLSKIVNQKQLVARAAKALLSLMGVLLAASLCLIPGQYRSILGCELVALGLLVWIGVTRSQRAASYNNPYIGKREKIFHFFLTQCSAIPFLLGGISLILGWGGGLYWLAAGTIFSLADALLDAWVLLIEILR